MCSKLSVTSHSILRVPVTWTGDRTYSGDRLAYTARWLRICCSRCGKKAAFSPRGSGAETTKPGREGPGREAPGLVALKAEHAHASGVAQSSSATGPAPPNEWLNGGVAV